MQDPAPQMPTASPCCWEQLLWALLKVQEPAEVGWGGLWEPGLALDEEGMLGCVQEGSNSADRAHLM